MAVRGPTWEYERQYAAAGVKEIAGVDEVGMGALAGPVVAGAVIFYGSGETKNLKRKRGNFDVAFGNEIVLRDSKQLSVKQRQRTAAWIKQQALAWAVGEASVKEITSLNILRASHLAMQRAVDALAVVPELLLVDGREMQVHPNVPAISLIHGDQICCSIAAASIVAKVHRDALMIELDGEYPGYGLAAHKGYGSASHLAALRSLGPCSCHRPTYEPVRAAALTEQ